jgi:hypothetical protein
MSGDSCPHCGGDVSVEPTYCRHCSRRVRDTRSCPLRTLSAANKPRTCTSEREVPNETKHTHNWNRVSEDKNIMSILTRLVESVLAALVRASNKTAR